MKKIGWSIPLKFSFSPNNTKTYKKMHLFHTLGYNTLIFHHCIFSFKKEQDKSLTLFLWAARTPPPSPMDFKQDVVNICHLQQILIRVFVRLIYMPFNFLRQSPSLLFYSYSQQSYSPFLQHSCPLKGIISQKSRKMSGSPRGTKGMNTSLTSIAVWEAILIFVAVNKAGFLKNLSTIIFHSALIYVKFPQ